MLVGTLVPMVMLGAVSPALQKNGLVRFSAELRRLVYFGSAVLVQIGIFSIRWNVVIGGQLFSKSLRGLTVYKLELLGGEGLAMAGGLMLLPLFVLFVLTKLLPPWPGEDAQAGRDSPVPLSAAG